MKGDMMWWEAISNADLSSRIKTVNTTSMLTSSQMHVFSLDAPPNFRIVHLTL